MNVLLLGSSGPLNLKVVYCLAQLGVQTHAVVTKTSNVVRKSRHTHSCIVNDGVSDNAPADQTVAWVYDYCVPNAISIVIPGDIGTAGFLAAAADRLGEIAVYPCSNAWLLNRIHDKWHFASTLMSASIATPKTMLIESILDVERVANEIGFPTMIKPLSGESSHGVLRIDSARALTKYLNSGRAYSSLPLIVQRFVAGKDIDISVLADRGRIVLGVTQQLQSDGSLRFFRDALTRRLAEAIVEEYAYHGIAHFDMRVDEQTGELVVLECNPRFWYSMPASMWQGVNFLEAGIHLALGQPVDDGSTLVPGHYFLPGALLSALRRPWLLKGLTWRNVKGVLQPALDPIPHLADMYQKRSL